MSTTLRKITLQQGEKVAPLYYGYSTTSGYVLTELNKRPRKVLEQIGEDVDGNALSWAKAIKPLVELTPVGITKLRNDLGLFAQGDEIDIDGKQALFGLEQFAEAALNMSNISYDQDLTGVTEAIAANNLGAELQEATSGDDPLSLISYLRDGITDPTFSEEAIAANFDQSSFLEIDLYPNMIGRRAVAATFLKQATNLTVGALFAAGVNNNDQLALATAEELATILN